MASEYETVEDLVKEPRGIKGGQHTNGGSSFERWRIRYQFADDYADRIETAHQREVAELKRQRNEALAIASDIDKCASIERHTDAMLKKNEVIVGLRKEVAELRECLKETMADAVAEYKNNSCFRNVKCGEIERCDTCKVMRWRKALKGTSND